MMEHKPELVGLKASDFRGNGVSVLFEDGTIFATPYGFVNYEGNFVVIYTEHNGYHTFRKTSVKNVIGTTYSDIQDEIFQENYPDHSSNQ